MAGPLPNFCPNCGKKMTWMTGDVRGICAGCGQAIHPARKGVVERFCRWLFGPRQSERTGVTRVVKVKSESQEFRVQDERTGQTKVYRSLEELPADVRERIEALSAEGAPAPATKYTVRDSSGVERTYRSLEEMPPDVRALFDQVRHK